MKKYNFQADLLRLLAIFAVTIIHLVHPIYSRPDFLGGLSWWVANIANGVSRVSVPLFIMLSGYLLIPKKESFENNLQRLQKRLLLPLFAWFFIFIAWDWYWFHKFHSFDSILKMIASGSMFHLYFLVILSGLYFLLPIIRLIKERVSVEQFWRGTRLLMWIGVVLYLIQYFILRDYSMFNFFTMWLPFLGYFLLGAQLQKPLASRRRLWFLYFCSLAVTIGLGYLNVWLRSMGADVFWRSSGVSYFDEYLSLNVIIMSVSLFQLCMHDPIFEKGLFANKYFQSCISLLSQASFGVFLIHFMVINYVDLRHNLAIEFLDTNILVYMIKRSSFVIIFSFILSLIGLRVPYVQRFFGKQ
jgi:surface polysaccharide O-acyltransferase-like enzyme